MKFRTVKKSLEGKVTFSPQMTRDDEILTNRTGDFISMTQTHPLPESEWNWEYLIESESDKIISLVGIWLSDTTWWEHQHQAEDIIEAFIKQENKPKETLEYIPYTSKI